MSKAAIPNATSSSKLSRTGNEHWVPSRFLSATSQFVWMSVTHSSGTGEEGGELVRTMSLAKGTISAPGAVVCIFLVGDRNFVGRFD